MKATVSNSITRNPTIRASLLLLAGLVLLIAGSAGRGQVLYSEEDAITIGGDVDRAKLRGAAQTLIETGDDLPSLEIILSHTKPKVVEAIPGNASYTFEDMRPCMGIGIPSISWSAPCGTAEAWPGIGRFE